MSEELIQSKFPIDFQWKTTDPFLFCAFHNDQYPKGNTQLGPDESLSGRKLGHDFEIKNGYRMYHGKVVPGFPVHPHRGFETITLVRKGYVDHADSLGAAGRYGAGDVQWMTAGRGIQHSEMFPLLNQQSANHLELLQIWINLPAKNKMVEAEYKMFWANSIPQIHANNGKVVIDIVAGNFLGEEAPSPPQFSWANNPENEVAVWVIEIQPGGEITIPASSSTVNRTLYHYDGSNILLNDQSLNRMIGTELTSTKAFLLKNTSNDISKILILQGRPIAEPVTQYGPFVMNTKQEIQQAIQDYQSTQFGRWPWDKEDMVHGSEVRRFGKHSNGQEEAPE